MLNNLFGSRTGGAGGGESRTTPPSGQSSLFDEADAGANFIDHLPPVPGGATITQEEHGTTPTGGRAVAAGGVTFPPVLAPPHTGWGGGAGGETPSVLTEAYSGIGSVLKTLGHTMYDTSTLEAELAVQCGITPGDATSHQTFRDFVVNVQQFRGYHLTMLEGKHVVIMLHTQGVYYSINSVKRAYQGRVLAFIGDRRLTKEPTPVCLPTTKTWEWHTGPAVADFSKLEAFYADATNGGNL